MNRRQKNKLAHYFARRWLEEVFTQCRRIEGFLRHLRMSGHLNCRYTSFDFDEQRYKAESFLRIATNMAMVLDEQEFFEVWDRLGQMIYEEGSNHGDEFNEIYGKHDREKGKEERTKGRRPRRAS